jgi:DNA polymerase-3 subunit delta'
MFLLITARPDVLLPTVRSRCPRLQFRPLAASDIAAVLAARGRPEKEARSMAAAAAGSLGRALEMTAGDLEIAREPAYRLLAGAASSDDPRRRIDLARDFLPPGGGDREQLAARLVAMASLVRDMELLSTGADVRALANMDLQPALDRLANVYRGDRALRAFTTVDEALTALDRNAGVKIVADWVALHV